MDEDRWSDVRAMKRLERIEKDKERSKKKWQDKVEKTDWLALESARRGDGRVLQEAYRNAD